MAQGTRLSAEDWTAAALVALGEGGLRAVAVEPLATRLGTTKGSFYWHFRNRDALLAAALQRWEKIDTEDVIRLAERAESPHARLRFLLIGALRDNPELPTGNAVELALQASAAHPLVAPVLQRVTRRRLAYLASLFTALGFDDPEAARRSLLAYTAYLGHAQLVHATPELAPQGAELEAYVEAVLARLTGT
ncbi:MAG: TetR/AcrR family transcriptional regulator [Pseudonocardia sp.]